MKELSVTCPPSHRLYRRSTITWTGSDTCCKRSRNVVRFVLIVSNGDHPGLENTMAIIQSQSYTPPSPSSTRSRQPGPSSSPLSAPSHAHHRRSLSSRAYHTRSPSLSSPTNPRFSHLFNTVLGSPFLTTTDVDLGLGPDPHLDLVDGAAHAVPRTHTITRPSSPALTADFSIIDLDPEDEDIRYPYLYAYQGYHGVHPGGHGRSASSMSAFGRRSGHSLMNPVLGNTGATPLKSIIPRIWDALSSPARSFTPSPSPPSTPSPPFSRYNTSAKGKAPAFDYQASTPAGYIDYIDLPPLDGEEGELIAIDDEACFIDVTAITGIGESISLPRLFSFLLVHVAAIRQPRGLEYYVAWSQNLRHLLCSILSIPTWASLLTSYLIQTSSSFSRQN